MRRQDLIKGCRKIALVLLMAAATTAIADPPDHAKAHGWRKKHDPEYVGYTGRAWERDYGILEGTCNRKEVGTVLGAVVGGALGSQIGSDSKRAVAIIVGSVIGAAIGREIGRDLDDTDRGCVGHALELGRDGERVRWLNESSGVNYILAPLGAFKAGDSCRSYTLTATRGAISRKTDGRACRASDGTWRAS